jgi:hypothetical protein
VREYDVARELTKAKEDKQEQQSKRGMVDRGERDE